MEQNIEKLSDDAMLSDIINAVNLLIENVEKIRYSLSMEAFIEAIQNYKTS